MTDNLCTKHLHFVNCLFSRFLATGDSFKTIAFNYRVGVSTVHSIVVDTCTAVWSVMQEKVIPVPDQSQWLQIAQRYIIYMLVSYIQIIKK